MIFHKLTFAGPIDLDGEFIEPEHWKTLFSGIYDFFIKNPLIISGFEYRIVS